MYILLSRNIKNLKIYLYKLNPADDNTYNITNNINNIKNINNIN